MLRAHPYAFQLSLYALAIFFEDFSHVIETPLRLWDSSLDQFAGGFQESAPSRLHAMHARQAKQREFVVAPDVPTHADFWTVVVLLGATFEELLLWIFKPPPIYSAAEWTPLPHEVS